MKKSLDLGKKKDLMAKRDLTAPELMMISNPIKVKDSYRNNSNNKNMNITLNDNINQNIFLKQIRQTKGFKTIFILRQISIILII